MYNSYEMPSLIFLGKMKCHLLRLLGALMIKWKSTNKKMVGSNTNDHNLVFFSSNLRKLESRRRIWKKKKKKRQKKICHEGNEHETVLHSFVSVTGISR